MELIKDTIKAVFAKISQKHPLDSDEDPFGWLKKTLTKRELRHIKVDYFRSGILGVSVDSSSWLYYFNLNKKTLAEKILKHTDKLKEIHFYLGEIN